MRTREHRRRQGDENTKQRIILGYRLGLYDPDPSVEGVEFVGRTFMNNSRDRAALGRIIANYNRKVADDGKDYLCLAAFPMEG